MLNTLQTASLENSVLQVSICQVYEGHGGDKHQPLLGPSQTLGTPGYSMLKGPARMLELTAFCIFIFIFIFYKIPGPRDTGFWFLFCF